MDSYFGLIFGMTGSLRSSDIEADKHMNMYR